MAISVSQAFKDAFKGPVDRTMIKVEVYFSAGLGWVDITPWVESMSGAQEEASALTRGASANTLSLTLNNDDGRFSRKNSAGPYYASGLGLVPNKPIRVSALHGSESVRLFTGYTGPWNTAAQGRRCSVNAQDAARLLRDHEVAPEILMDPSNPGQGYYLTRVIERAAWLAGLRWDAVTTRSADWTSTAHGGTITPTYDGGAVRAVYTQGGMLVMTLDLVDLRIPVADLRGHALELISKLAEVVDGKVYFDAQGQLVFRARMYLNDSAIAVSETFSVSNLEDVTAQANFEDSQFAPLINRATVTSKPLTPVLDAAGNWTEQEIVVTSFEKSEFDTGEKYPDSGDPDLFIAFPDGIRIHRAPGYPSAANITLRSSYSEDTTRELNGIVFTDGTPVFFDDAVKVVFRNSGVGRERLKEMVIRVKHFRAAQGCKGVAENATSQALYGLRAVEVSNDIIPTVAACKQLAAWKVEDGREVKDYLTLPVMYGLPWLEINDRIKVSETISRTIPVEEEFIVKRISWSWTLAGFLFTIEACTPSPNFSAGSLPSTAVITETANINLAAAVKAGMPAQAIDGTQTLVGLNNVPGLEWITRRAQSLEFGTAVTQAKSCVYDGSRIYLYRDNATDGGVVALSPLTGGIVQTWDAFAPGFEMRLSVASDSSLIGHDWYSIVKLKLGWNTKAFIPNGFGYDNDRLVEVLAYGGQIFAHVGKLPGYGNDHALWVWYSDDDVNQSTPDRKYDISVQGLSGGEVLAFDDEYAYVIERLYDSSQSAQVAALSRYDLYVSIFARGYAYLNPGEDVYCMVSDGRYLWIGVHDTVASTHKIIQAEKNPQYIDGSIRPVRIREIPLADTPKRLMYDGMYIWALTATHLYQLSTLGGTIASYLLGSSPGTPKGLTFDGVAVWATIGTGVIFRVPRIVTGRQF